MKRLIIAAIALSLAACSNDPQVQEDPQPSEQEQTTEQESTEQTEQTETTEQTDQGAQAGESDVKQLLEQAATGEHRSQENIARNQYRNPVETLSFFGIEPDMTVVEIWPGGGWYTEVLAPTLTDGELIAASFAPKPEEPEHYRNRLYKALQERIQNDEAFSNVELGMLQPDENKVDIGEEGSADMVVTFRNFHSFISAGIADEMLQEAYRVLKPGGILGVVQHRADEGANPQESAKKGYVPEQYVIEQAKEAGFELVEKSEINANPKDTKDYAEGVWTLPPSYRLGDKDREKYEAIGESDRMTLKFRKPAGDSQSAEQAAGGEATDRQAATEADEAAAE